MVDDGLSRQPRHKNTLPGMVFYLGWRWVEQRHKPACVTVWSSSAACNHVISPEEMSSNMDQKAVMERGAKSSVATSDPKIWNGGDCASNLSTLPVIRLEGQLPSKNDQTWLHLICCWQGCSGNNWHSRLRGYLFDPSQDEGMGDGCQVRITVVKYEPMNSLLTWWFAWNCLMFDRLISARKITLATVTASI